MATSEMRPYERILPCGCVVAVERISLSLDALLMRPVCDEARSAMVEGKLRRHLGLPQRAKVADLTRRLLAGELG